MCMVCQEPIEKHQSWQHNHEGMKHTFCKFIDDRVHINGQQALARLVENNEPPFSIYLRKPYWKKQIALLTKQKI